MSLAAVRALTYATNRRAAVAGLRRGAPYAPSVARRPVGPARVLPMVRCFGSASDDADAARSSAAAPSALREKTANLRERGAERAASLREGAAKLKRRGSEGAAKLKRRGSEGAARLVEKKDKHAAWVAAEGRDLSLSQKLKRLIYAYGPLALGFHLGCEALAFGSLYAAVSSGAIDVVALLASVEYHTGYDAAARISPGAGNAVVAYILTGTLTGIPRTVLTLTATPAIARKLGWRPKPPAAEDA